MLEENALLSTGIRSISGSITRMRFQSLGAAFSVLLLVHAASLLPPFAFSLLSHDGQTANFGYLLVFELVIGGLFWLKFRRMALRLRTRDGFLIVAFMWLLISTIGAIPFMLCLGQSPVDAIFESVSGFTTTGATSLTALDDMARSILFYRQEIQWIGGIGVIVSAMALFPMLGVGGMQLLKAETPGPIKNEKLTPRLQQTVRIIWQIYLLMTVSCASMYWLADMPLFDAVAHSLTTVSTGGFSTHDASLGYFDSPAIELVAMTFMVFGSINFGLHIMALKKLNIQNYLRNEEFRALVGVLTAVSVFVAFVLCLTDVIPGWVDSIRYSAFQVVSVMTSTGFATENFSVWPLFLPVLLIFVSFIGGCAGSTAGGMKVLRFVVLAKQARIEIVRLLHPNIVRPVKLDGRPVNEQVIQSIWAFFAIYITTFAFLMICLMADGLDQISAFGAIATCLNNLGPGLGKVAESFADTTDFEKWVLSAAMLLGRLEILTFFVLLTPTCWRD